MIQRRPLSFDELVHQPAPEALVGSTLHPYESMLQALCFQDNERGDSANLASIYTLRVLNPANRRLRRNGKSLRLLSLVANHQRHHALDVTYCVRGVQRLLSISLFAPSKKTLAAERAGDSDQQSEYSPPRRGKKIRRR